MNNRKVTNMANRFDKPHLQLHKRLTVALPMIFAVAVLVIVIAAISDVGNTTYEKQQESLESALNRSITQCYAVEGFYPPDIAYLEEHYGLTYDKDVFLVDYEYWGGNLLPEVTVIRKTGETL